MADFAFQWDDGNFISPFVAASEGDMEIFAGWLVARFLTTLTASAPKTAAKRLEMRLTDLGCGDATAILSLAQYVRKGWRELATTVEGSSQSFLHLLVTGVELDDALLVKAEDNAAAFATCIASPTSSPVSVETHFVNADIRFADLDVYFPRHVAIRSSTASVRAAAPPLTSPPYVLYMYLLPDALEVLLEKLLEVLRRGWIVASNRWPIPGLDHLLKERAGHVHVYYQ
ncbi:hypothetical protein ABB37_02030 [Leptomonas pyrrhocoris]|uniref:Uncharacterized protein n=1 Tax=Leptomonas pyrrhocoris TaxID=157538 RepID=A0A0N0VGQ4_LEPPY|nr:hypothetical protein ABB37_02030 [Leptomonas pyrrhocoris]KPA83821.1 hypothetical protein ABB37_02030 [Leptomonas pyrrhocoris]|eukprot:XP_015662260.1 hypothetical protein ABB37_02030 [Leptomonas pyrrhocoris]